MNQLNTRLFNQIHAEEEPIIFNHEVEQEAQTAPTILSLNAVVNLDVAEIAEEAEDVQEHTEYRGRESV